MSIKRYSHECNVSDNYLPLCETVDGMWMAYEDHMAEVERLRARIPDPDDLRRLTEPRWNDYPDETALKARLRATLEEA